MTFVPPILEEPEYNTDIPYAVAIDGRGGILVAGYGTTHPFALERFNADGMLDTTLGNRILHATSSPAAPTNQEKQVPRGGSE